jgi:hypothetical protein
MVGSTVYTAEQRDPSLHAIRNLTRELLLKLILLNTYSAQDLQLSNSTFAMAEDLEC